MIQRMSLNAQISCIAIFANVICTAQFTPDACDSHLIFLVGDHSCDTRPYCLVFEDEFDGSSLDLSKWRLMPHSEGALYGANDAQVEEYNSLNNVEVSDGTAKIWIREEPGYRSEIHYLDPNLIMSDGLPNYRFYQYTSSNIWSVFQYNHGYYEIRCRIPNDYGLWPAFWLYGEDNNGANNEIDVFEFWDNSTFIHHMSVHYNNNQEKCSDIYVDYGFPLDYYTYGVEWDQFGISWYLNGNLVKRSSRFYTVLGQQIGCNSLGQGQYIRNNVHPMDPMHIIMNVARQTKVQVGDHYITNPLSPNLPAFMEIDYVRYYQRDGCSGELNLNNIVADDLIHTFLTGTRIRTYSSFEVQESKQLELAARDEIILDPGTEITSGAIFIANIREDVCNSYEGMVAGADTSLSLKFHINEDSFISGYSGGAIRDNDIQVFPNPTLEGQFTIAYTTDTEKSIVIRNLMGQVVYETNSHSTINQLDISSEPSGVYLLSIRDRYRAKVDRLIIKQ